MESALIKWAMLEVPISGHTIGTAIEMKYNGKEKLGVVILLFSFSNTVNSRGEIYVPSLAQGFFVRRSTRGILQ